jgi:transcription elongation factor Elf1
MWLEQKYIGLVSNRLDRFKRVKNNLYNFRCPVCGDSQKNKYKARGFIFEKSDGGYLYHCHNCNITLGIDKFLQTIDPIVYKEYIKEKLSTGFTKKERVKSDAELFAEKMKTPVFAKKSGLDKLQKISSLDHNHVFKKYVMHRKIPSSYHYKLYYAPKFKEFVNTLVPDKFDTKSDESRLVIPFLNEKKELIGIQGRSLAPDSIRYITIMIDNNSPKVFGLDTCDRTKTHYILEGPIDSMFVDNSIAMAGGFIDWNLVNEQSVFVYDNEPRSKETCKKIQKVIDKNHKVVIWPEAVKQKDVNDMILENQSIDINQLLYNNISTGLEAKLLYTAWKRI